jgi:carboxymethylenebutenolidase
MGGTIAFLAACKLSGLSCAVAFYGGQIAKNADEKPKIPVQMHFGDNDASIPMSDVELIKQKRGGDCEIFVYANSGHGFNCEERGSYNEAAAKLGRQRALEFVAKHLK